MYSVLLRGAVPNRVLVASWLDLVFSLEGTNTGKTPLVACGIREATHPFGDASRQTVGASHNAETAVGSVVDPSP